MQFENTPGGGSGDSYEKPKPGKYLGVLVGFAFIGTQPGGQYGPKPKVMLRWELHKRKGPSIDSKGFIHTIAQRFGATVRGENSLLRKALEAHGVNVAEGQTTASHDWLGHAAWLDIEEETGDNGKEYVNVKAISRLDPDDDEIPARVLPLEHWDDSDAVVGFECPEWAAWAVAKSTDLSDLAPKFAGGGGKGKKRTVPAREPAANGAAVGAAVGATTTDADQGDDIPF